MTECLKPEMLRPRFLDVKAVCAQTSLREMILDDAVTVESMMILNSSIRPKVDCAAIQISDDYMGKTLGRKTIGDLDLKAEHGILVLLIQRGEEIIECPNFFTELKKDDWLFIAGQVNERGIKNTLAETSELDLPQTRYRPFYPEFDQFEFPTNCHGAIIGPVKFCARPGQKALNLRGAFSVNLVAIQRANGEVLGPKDITPRTEICPGDVGVVCRVPLPSGFSKSVLTKGHLQKLERARLAVSTEESVAAAKSEAERRVLQAQPCAACKGSGKMWPGVCSRLPFRRCACSHCGGTGSRPASLPAARSRRSSPAMRSRTSEISSLRQENEKLRQQNEALRFHAMPRVGSDPTNS